MRATLTAVVVVLATPFVVGCTQSTSPSVAPSAVIAPASAQAGPSVAPSAVAAPTSAHGGPGASYDASGLWHVVVRDAPSGNPNGNVLDDEDSISFTQDADGNLHGEGEDAGATLTRRGTGRTIAYTVSVFEDHPDCDTVLSGTAQLDTTANTIQVHLSGIEEGCESVNFWVTLTRP